MLVPQSHVCGISRLTFGSQTFSPVRAFGHWRSGLGRLCACAKAAATPPIPTADAGEEEEDDACDGEEGGCLRRRGWRGRGERAG